MLAWEMLHSVVVGPVGIDNAYFEAFIEGFQLPCSTGVDLVDVRPDGYIFAFII